MAYHFHCLLLLQGEQVSRGSTRETWASFFDLANSRGFWVALWSSPSCRNVVTDEMIWVL